MTFRVTAWPGYTLPSPGLISASRAQETAVPSCGSSFALGACLDPSRGSLEHPHFCPQGSRPKGALSSLPSAQLLPGFACGARVGQLLFRHQTHDTQTRLLGVRTRKLHFSLRIKVCGREIRRVNNLLQSSQIKRNH